MRRWVQHKSGQGDKWELTEEQSPTYGTTEWRVKAEDPASFHQVPKSEYILVDPPEQWDDVTEYCTAGEFGKNIFTAPTHKILNSTKWIVDDSPNGENVMSDERYRLRKIDGMHNGPAFIVERKRS